MTKLPQELCKLRDNLVHPHANFQAVWDGFDAGAEAMRNYMQAEMDKLFENLECNKTFHRLGGIDDCDPCKFKASYRAWKEGQK